MNDVIVSETDDDIAFPIAILRAETPYGLSLTEEEAEHVRDRLTEVLEE